MSEALRRQEKQEIHPTEAEERNMGEAIESPLETRIAAQPLLLVKVQPEDEADAEANHNPQPRENQVKLCSVRVHDFKFRLNDATIADRPWRALIDKISGVIDLGDSSFFGQA